MPYSMMVCYKSAVPIRASGGGERGERRRRSCEEGERRKERRKREGKDGGENIANYVSGPNKKRLEIILKIIQNIDFHVSFLKADYGGICAIFCD